MSTPSIRIATIEIPVRVLDRASTWYEKALGLTIEWSDEHHAMLVSADKHGPRLLLVETDDGARLAFTSSHTSIAHSVIDVEVDDLEALHAKLTSLGQPVDELGPPKNDWAPKGFGFSDTEGNRLGAYQYRAEP